MRIRIFIYLPPKAGFKLAWATGTASPEVGLESKLLLAGGRTLRPFAPSPVLVLTWFLSTPHPGSGIGQGRLG